MKTLSVLGSTGSIGKQTLDVAARYGFPVLALASNKSTLELERQARRFLPRYAALADERAANDLRVRLADTNITVLSGPEGVLECAMVGDAVVLAVNGFAGLAPALGVIRRGARLAIANKETLVAAGRLITAEAARYEAELIPVDSEHSAIFQCLHTKQARSESDAFRIILTCSGGAFRGFSFNQLDTVTPETALSHPIWSMGAKVSIDSATLMNKGLEYIEAMYLFNVNPDRIDVVVHPQSIIHGAVEYDDGAVIAMLSEPDMRVPIQYALTYPNRLPSNTKPLSLTRIAELTFEQPDISAFRCLSLAMETAKRDYTNLTNECLALNAANEIAVDAFLSSACGFNRIPEIIETVLSRYNGVCADKLDDLTALDTEVRSYTKECI